MKTFSDMLRKFQSRGGGRIPLPSGETVTITRRELESILDSIPTAESGKMHRAVQSGDIQTAQAIFVEAAARFKGVQ
jgi:hypothetical protein